MQHGDFGSSYYPYPQSASNPIDYHPPPPAPPPATASSYASAPPFTSTTYGSSDYLPYPQNYPPFPHNSDPVPSLSSPTAPPSYNPAPTVISGPNPPPPPVQQHPVPQYHPASQGQDSPGFYPHQSSNQQPPPPVQYPPYDPPHSSSNYPPSLSSSYPGPNSNSNSSLYPSNFGNANSSGPSLYESPHESSSKLDHGSGSSYLDDTLNRYGSYGTSGFGRSRSDLGSEIYGKRPESVGGRGLYDSGIFADEGSDDGVYAYKGKSEPYGSRGTAPKSSTWSGAFDDYGRAISFPTEREKSTSHKVVRAVPKVETQSDAKGGVQKFRVKLLPESGGQGVMDVLCQVGLDGVRMLDPNTSRTLRIYPLENVTRCDKFDSSTFAFWSKTSVDIEPRRIRLQSSSYTTNTLLDTVTAAIVQFKEMGGRSMPSESSRLPEKPTEKKKGLTDWVVKLKPINEEKDHWVPDEAVSKCTSCGTDFGAFVRRHHCRNCGDIYCDKCTQGRTALTADENAPAVRVCDRCMAEVTRRLSNAKEAPGRSTVLQSHEDLAKKLQDEMERNRRSSSGSKSDASGRRTREVACPTCTVHLQVQVPSSGSETIECGVCQHPFLVSAH